MQKFYDMDQLKSEFTSIGTDLGANKRIMPRIEFAARMQSVGLLKALNSSMEGLSEEAHRRNIMLYGMNNCPTYLSRMDCALIALKNPIIFGALAFLLMFMCLQSASMIRFAAWSECSKEYLIIVFVACVLGVLVTYSRYDSLRSNERLSVVAEMVEAHYTIRRSYTGEINVGFHDLVVGDIILLSEGEVVPADVRILEESNFSVNQSLFTANDFPVEKNAVSYYGSLRNLSSCTNIALAGSRIVSGKAIGIVVAQGSDVVLNKDSHWL